MTAKHPFVKWCREHNACPSGIRAIKRYRTPQDWWHKTKYGPHMQWLLLFVLCKDKSHRRWIDCHHTKSVAAAVLAITAETGAQTVFQGLREEPDLIRKKYPRIPWPEKKS